MKKPQLYSLVSSQYFSPSNPRTHLAVIAGFRGLNTALLINLAVAD